MPLYDEDGASGSGFSPKTRLDLPTITGDMSAPVTRGELADFARKIKDWSQRLEFGRVGFTVRTFPLDEPGALAADTPWTFDQIVEDSNGFAKTFMDPDLTYFQVPPGMGRPYAINYYVNFAFLVENTDTFNYTGAVQEWTAPSTILENTATFWCRGGGGSHSVAGGTEGGYGAEASAKFNNVTPSSVWDVYVGNGATTVSNANWPNGGAGDDVATGNSGAGGGSTDIRPDGGTMADTYVCAGGGGGAGRLGPSQPQPGGDGGYPAGGTQGGGGGTQSAGGAAGGAGATLGNPGTFGQGGAAGDSTNSFAFTGGGGGGGWYGGGSGATAQASGTYGGGGGGGSSHIKATGDNQSHAVASTKVAGQASVTYYSTTPAPDGAVITKVWVAYAQYPNKNAYEEVRVVVSDEGAAPHKGAVILPLGEGDRVWMTVENSEGTFGILNFTFGMYAQGQ